MSVYYSLYDILLMTGIPLKNSVVFFVSYTESLVVVFFFLLTIVFPLFLFLKKRHSRGGEEMCREEVFEG